MFEFTKQFDFRIKTFFSLLVILREMRLITTLLCFVDEFIWLGSSYATEWYTKHNLVLLKNLIHLQNTTKSLSNAN